MHLRSLNVMKDGVGPVKAPRTYCAPCLASHWPLAWLLAELPRSCVFDDDAIWQRALPGRVDVGGCAGMTALEQLPHALDSIRFSRPVIRAGAVRLASSKATRPRRQMAQL